jgi:hypothetical protein
MVERLEHIEWDRNGDFFVYRTEIPVPLLSRSLRVRVVADGRAVSAAQAESLAELRRLPPERREDFTHPVALDCWFTCQEIEIDGEEPPVILRKRTQVWRHVDLREILIPRHGKSRDRYVFLHGNCDWDREHGLELLLKNGRLLRVGRQEGLFCSEEWGLYYISE